MTTRVQPPRQSHLSPRLVRHPHFSRLGVGLMVLGGAGLMHSLWGVAVDLPLLLVGASGLVWALASRHAIRMVAGSVLVAVALFALFDDHGVFASLTDTLTLLALVAALVLAHGLPVRWRDAWPLVPAGVLVLIAAFVVIRLAAAWAATPWLPTAPLLVLLAGLALLTRGGSVP